MGNKIAFTGEIGKADCDCHKGKTAVTVYIILPTDGKKIFLAQKFFDDPKQAEEKFDDCVAEIAAITLKEFGLSSEGATVTKARGDDAVKMERDFVTEIRGLH